MSYKSDRISQRISQLQAYISDKGASHPVLKETRESATKLAADLSSGKLLINIISPLAGWAENIQKYFGEHPDISNIFATDVKESPWQMANRDTETPPTLILQNPTASPTGQNDYSLSSMEPVIIGRDPKRATLLISNQASTVSGSHATLKPVEWGRNGSQNHWQVCDNNSTNGTFVNEQRVLGCHTLQSGDHITLGCATPNGKGAEFVFVHQTVNRSAIKKLYQEINACDVLCVVVDPVHLKSKTMQDLIENINVTWLSKFYLIVADPSLSVDSGTSSQHDQILQMLTKGLKSNVPPLEIAPFLYDSETTVPKNLEEMPVEATSLLDKLSRALAALVHKKSEDILINRLALQINAQVAQIDQVLIEQEETLKGQFERESQMLNGIGVEQLKDRLKRLLDEAKNRKDAFFSQVRIDLNRAKADMLDPLAKNGVLGKIQLFTDNMMAEVIKKANYSYVRLTLHNLSGSVDPAILNFCREGIGNWSQKEWNRALSEYGGGGLTRLIQYIESSLTITSSPINVEAINQPVRKPNLIKGLDESIMGVKTEEMLRESSFGSYFIKKCRSTVFAVTGIAAMGVGLFSWLIGRESLNGQHGLPNLPFVHEIWFRSLSIPVLIGFVIYLVRDYRNSRKLSIEGISEKLKKDFCNHYQVFARDRVSRLTEEMLLALDAEDKRLRDALNQVEEQLSMQVKDIKNKLDDIKARQQLVTQERSKLNQLRV